MEQANRLKWRTVAVGLVAWAGMAGCATPVARQVDALQAADACCSEWRGMPATLAPGEGWTRITLDQGSPVGEFWGRRGYFQVLDVAALAGRELEVRSYYLAHGEPQYPDPVLVVLDANADVIDVWTPQLRRRAGGGFVTPANESHLWARWVVPEGAATAVVVANDGHGVGRRAHAAGEPVQTGDWNSLAASAGPAGPRLERAPTGLLRVRIHDEADAR